MAQGLEMGDFCGVSCWSRLVYAYSEVSHHYAMVL